MSFKIFCETVINSFFYIKEILKSYKENNICKYISKFCIFKKIREEKNFFN